MVDIGYKQTNESINKLEKDLEAIYIKAYAKIKQDLSIEMQKIKELPPTATAQERYIEAQKANRLEKIALKLTDLLNQTNKAAMDISYDTWIKSYIDNYNFASYVLGVGTDNIDNFPPITQNEAEKVLKDDTNPLNIIAMDDLEDKKQLSRDIKSVLIAGVLAGLTISTINKNLKSVIDKNYNQAVKIGTTETGRVESVAKFSVFEKGSNEHGIKQEKEWIATLDKRTRRAHAKADGQTVPLDKPFIVGGEKMMYPRDPAGGASNVIRCRCQMITKIKDLDPSVYDRITYKEWSKKNGG